MQFAAYTKDAVSFFLHFPAAATEPRSGKWTGASGRPTAGIDCPIMKKKKR